MTVILRHRRENLKKCSLRGLEKRADFRFYTYPQEPLPEMPETILLTMGAPPLTREDGDKNILLIDGTWKLAATMEKSLPKGFIERSLPCHFRTAYPRRQTECPDPDTGLASIEALYIAFFILGRPLDGLLEHYHWREAFFQRNPELQSCLSCL